MKSLLFTLKLNGEELEKTEVKDSGRTSEIVKTIFYEERGDVGEIKRQSRKNWWVSGRAVYEQYVDKLMSNENLTLETKSKVY